MQILGKMSYFRILINTQRSKYITFEVSHQDRDRMKTVWFVYCPWSMVFPLFIQSSHITLLFIYLGVCISSTDKFLSFVVAKYIVSDTHAQRPGHMRKVFYCPVHYSNVYMFFALRLCGKKYRETMWDENKQTCRQMEYIEDFVKG